MTVNETIKLVNNNTDIIGLADIDKHSRITYAIPDEWKDYVKQEINKAVKPDININNLSTQQIILEPNQYYIHFKAFLGTNIKNVGKYIYRIINAETTDCDNVCNQLIVYENIIDKKLWARNTFIFKVYKNGNYCRSEMIKEY